MAEVLITGEKTGSGKLPGREKTGSGKLPGREKTGSGMLPGPGEHPALITEYTGT